MSSQKSIWIDDLDTISTSVNDRFRKLNYLQLNSKPNASSWSIAQILEHLISVNNSYYPTFDALLSGTYTIPWTGKFTFLTRFFGKVILNSVQPSNKHKTKAPTVWEPSQSDIDKDVLDRFSASQSSLKDYILKLDNQIENDVVISSPANKFVLYPLSKGFDIILAHEKRHLQQAISLIST